MEIFPSSADDGLKLHVLFYCPSSLGKTIINSFSLCGCFNCPAAELATLAHYSVAVFKACTQVFGSWIALFHMKAVIVETEKMPVVSVKQFTWHKVLWCVQTKYNIPFLLSFSQLPPYNLCPLSFLLHSFTLFGFFSLFLCTFRLPPLLCVSRSLISQSTELNMRKPNQSGHDMVIIFKCSFLFNSLSLPRSLHLPHWLSSFLSVVLLVECFPQDAVYKACLSSLFTSSRLQMNNLCYRKYCGRCQRWSFNLLWVAHLFNVSYCPNYSVYVLCIKLQRLPDCIHQHVCNTEEVRTHAHTLLIPQDFFHPAQLFSGQWQLIGVTTL